MPDVEWKTIVCLANSRKLSGRCVAGVEVRDRRPVGWVRPISARAHGEVSEYERQFKDGSDPAVLDVIRVPLLRPQPGSHQSENWLLEPSIYWEKVRVLNWHELALLADEGPLWPEGTSSTNNGCSDRVDVESAAGVTGSLSLVHVDDLALRVYAPGANFGDPKRYVQAQFSHAGSIYHLRVTDPVCEREYLALANETYPIGEAYVTVSLGEAWEGHVYKLAAAVITPERARGGA